jgi:drug/metabolite transporter (DMT)-like permease
LQLIRVFCALIAMLCGFTAVIHMPLADATAIFFAKSFFVTIFAVFFLAEFVGIYRWSAVLIGFVGVVIMLQPGTDNFSIYGLASLAGAAGAAGVMILLRLLSRSDSAATIMTYGALGVGIVMTIPGIYYWQQPTRMEWMLLAAVAVVSYYGQKCNIFAYKHGEASLLASLDYLRLLWATISFPACRPGSVRASSSPRRSLRSTARRGANATGFRPVAFTTGFEAESCSASGTQK